MRRWSLLLSVLLLGSAAWVADAVTVRNVRVDRRGGGLVKEEAVLAFTSLKPGDELNRAALARDVRALEKSGRFSYVAADVEQAADGVTVVYTVSSKPRIRTIRVEGADDIGNRKIRELLELGPGDLVDDATVALKSQKVREHYEKKYYPYAKITWTIDEQPASGTADLAVRVVEGRRALVKRVVFPGQIPDPGRTRRIVRALFPWAFDWPAFTGHDLRSAMKQRQSNAWSWLTAAGLYKPEDLDADPELVRRVLMDRGFLDARVGEPVVTNLTAKRLQVLMPVEPGPQYRLGQIDLQGVSLFPKADVARVITNRPQDVASLGALERTQGAVKDYYGSRGYISSDVRYQLTPRGTAGVVDVALAVSEGKLAHIRDINIRGNTRTKDKVIRRELTVYPGEIFNEVKVRNSERRLRNLGYFSFVNGVPEETPDPEKYDLALDLEEQKTGQFLVGAGFSSVDDLIGFAELSQGNFDLFNWPPTGGGQKLKLRGTVGTKRRDVELSFVEPWFLDRKLSLGVDLFQRDRRFLSDEYDQRNTGMNLSLGKPLTSFSRVNFIYGLENIDVNNVDTNASDLIKAEEGNQLKSSFTIELVRDSRDSAFVATRGMRSSLAGTVAGGALGGDVEIYQVEAQVSKYWPLWFDHVLNLRGWTAVVEGYGEGDRVPLFDRLFLGGARTLRGFKYRQVGPKDETGEPVGGKSGWYATAEYTVPVVEKVRLATFYDLGMVYEDAFQWDGSNYNSDWGFGVRLDFPGFPLRLDYAWPLEADDFNDRNSGRFQFSIGYVF